MTTGIKVRTKFGADFYDLLSLQYKKVLGNANMYDGYLKALIDEKKSVDTMLTEFLDDDNIQRMHKMDDDDVTGWQYYNELSDKSDVLNLYIGRLK